MAKKDIKFKIDVEMTLWSAIKLRIAGFRYYTDKIHGCVDAYLDSADGRAKIQKITTDINKEVV